MPSLMPRRERAKPVVGAVLVFCVAAFYYVANHEPPLSVSLSEVLGVRAIAAGATQSTCFSTVSSSLTRFILELDAALGTASPVNPEDPRYVVLSPSSGD